MHTRDVRENVADNSDHAVGQTCTIMLGDEASPRAGNFFIEGTSPFKACSLMAFWLEVAFAFHMLTKVDKKYISRGNDGDETDSTETFKSALQECTPTIE